MAGDRYNPHQHLAWTLGVIDRHGEAAAYVAAPVADEVEAAAVEAAAAESIDGARLEAVRRLCAGSRRRGLGDGAFDALYYPAADLRGARDAFSRGVLAVVYPERRADVARDIEADGSIPGRERFWLLHACDALPFYRDPRRQ